MKLEIEVGEPLIEYFKKLETPFMYMPVEEQIRDYLQFCSGDRGGDFKPLINQWLLKNFGEASLPKEKSLLELLREWDYERDMPKCFYLFLLSSTPYPGIHGKSFRIRSEFNLPEREVLQNTHFKDIKIIIMGEAEDKIYWCRIYDNPDHYSYIPPECFEFPWVIK